MNVTKFLCLCRIQWYSTTLVRHFMPFFSISHEGKSETSSMTGGTGRDVGTIIKLGGTFFEQK